MIQKINKNLFYFFVLSIFIASCSIVNDEIPPELTAYNESVVLYFKEIAFGFEYGNASEITRRWEDNMKIFIGGQVTPEF